MAELSDRIGIILNPNAGMFRTKKGLKAFQRLAGRWGENDGFLNEKYGDKIVLGAKKKADAVQYTCDEFLDSKVGLVISVGGDGTQGNIHTNMARRVWERNRRTREEIYGDVDKKDMITFLKQLNTKTGTQLPYFYNVKGGTVYVCSSMLKFTDNLELAIDNALLAIDKGYGMESFRRLYVPTIIGYSAKEPDNTSRMEVMFQYADAGIRRFFDEYYKDKGPGKPNRKTAYWLIGKAVASLPIPGGFIHQLAKKIPCNVELDNVRLPIEQRSTLIASTLNGSLYGLRPFYQAWKEFDSFPHHYAAGEKEDLPEQSVERGFHVMTGDIDPWRIVLAIPNALMGKKMGIKDVYDTIVKEASIEQLKDIKYTADGTRKDDAKKLVLTSGFEIGMPFLHENPILK